MIRFTIPGPPVGKQRARSTRSGHHYTPKKTRDYEAAVSVIAKAVMKGEPPWDGPVGSHIVCVFPVPKSWSKKKRAAALSGEIRPKKPDADNLEKAVWDACNGIVYRDDSQICTWGGNKRYGNRPRVEVTFWKIDLIAQEESV